jgi:hypothetical protein
MKRADRTDIRFWPFQIAVEGDRAIAALKWPLALVLIAVSVAIVGMTLIH